MMIRFWKSLCAAMVVALLIGFMSASLRAANTVDGTTSTAPNGPSLVTTAGTWTWGVSVSGRPSEYKLNLNNAWAGTAFLMEVANGGQLYADTSFGWYLYGAGNWSSSAGPSMAQPPPISPDGTTSTAPTGAALTTTAGTWTWGSAVGGRPGEYQLNLNGAWSGTAFLMEVANGGQLYVNTSFGWYLYGAGGWASSSPPGTLATLKVMPLGDSQTLGAYSAMDFGIGGYRAPLWYRLVANNFTVDYVGSQNGPAPADVDPNHEGHGGYRIDDISGSIDDWIASTNPQIIMLFAGVNDLIQGAGVATAIARMNTLLDQVSADAPTARVLVSTLLWVPQPNFYNLSLAQIQDFNSRLPALVSVRANQGKPIVLVDMYNSSGVTAGDFNPDGVHPTATGYAKMSNVWYTALTPFLH